MAFTCTVYGIAKPQPRPRRAKHGGVYTPQTATEWKKAIVRAVREAGEFPAEPMTGPIYANLQFFLPRPKRLAGPKYSDGPILKATRPDIDNYEKALLDCLGLGRGRQRDGLHAGLWVDDGQVCQSWCVKRYCGKDGEPRTHIYVEAI